MFQRSWIRRFGLALTVPCVLLAFALAGHAVWEARPLPACLSGGLDPFHPAQKCRRVTMMGGVPVTGTVGGSSLKVVEQGSVSGMPDLRPAGLAVVLALVIYLTSWGIDRLLQRRVRLMTG
ncbi:MAG: hypothetical protein K2Y29_20695 [Beijerinckiaceae bacterium]|nr:hypothetical protein [Beijerinckiaceae bacterium]